MNANNKMNLNINSFVGFSIINCIWTKVGSLIQCSSLFECRLEWKTNINVTLIKWMRCSFVLLSLSIVRILVVAVKIRRVEVPSNKFSLEWISVCCFPNFVTQLNWVDAYLHRKLSAVCVSSHTKTQANNFILKLIWNLKHYWHKH